MKEPHLSEKTQSKKIEDKKENPASNRHSQRRTHTGPHREDQTQAVAAFPVKTLVIIMITMFLQGCIVMSVSHHIPHSI